jgi:hypothetical protein
VLHGIQTGGDRESGNAENNLGTALSSLGERESGTEWFEQGVAAYHAGLYERSRESGPFNLSRLRAKSGAYTALLNERREANTRERSTRRGTFATPRLDIIMRNSSRWACCTQQFSRGPK